jgi:hypothetical protein
MNAERGLSPTGLSLDPTFSCTLSFQRYMRIIAKKIGLFNRKSHLLSQMTFGQWFFLRDVFGMIHKAAAENRNTITNSVK